MLHRAITYFLQSWSVPYLVVLILLLNLFYRANWIDPRNKAYGLNYLNKNERPPYTREGLWELCSPEKVAADKQNMISILEIMEKKTTTGKTLAGTDEYQRRRPPQCHFHDECAAVSRQYYPWGNHEKNIPDQRSIGRYDRCHLFPGALLTQLQGKQIHLQDKAYLDDIAGDLLNPLFTSFFARDLIAPAQKFSVGPYQYVKDRGYAFEQKLGQNTRGVLNKRLKDYKADETAANIPLMFFNSVVTRDGRKMMIVHTTGAVYDAEPS